MRLHSVRSKIRFTASLTLFAALAAACSQARPLSKVAASFGESSSKIRYEAARESGELFQSAIVEDPLRPTYDRTVWAASNQSAVTTLKGVPSANRVNLVFVGDGYTQSQIAAYAADVSRSVASILLQQPFKSYANYFAFHRVDVVSQESGVTHAGGRAVRTALEMNYGCGGLDRLLCANLSKVMKEAQNAPAVDVVFALANDSEYGGAGYLKPAVATFAARNPSSLELALHELGHSFVGLGDEYEDEGVASECMKFANVSKDTRAMMETIHSKWFRWLDLPNVSAFPGSCYSRSFFRPTDASKMRVLGHPYEEVNTEQFILKIYGKVKPIESATPPGKFSAAGVIWIKPMQPSDHDLDVSWALNGKNQPLLAGAKQVEVSRLSLNSGANILSVTVKDTTKAVRDEAARKSSMTQTLSWQIVR